MKSARLIIAMAFAVLLSAFMSGCHVTHEDWKLEAERTNQMQIHENGLTERQALSNSMVSDAIDNMNK